MKAKLSCRLGLATATYIMVCVAFLGFISSACESRTSSETTAALRDITCAVPALSPNERVDRCLQLLNEEMTSPSSPSFGIGGGPIDNGYLQEIIMGSVCTPAQKGTEREEIRSIVAAKLESTPAPNQALRDRLTIILGHTGDRGVIPQLINILEKHPDGFMRFSAVMALRDIEDPKEAVPALQNALANDTYARIRFSGSFRQYDSKTMVYSPIRDIAAEVLRRMKISVPRGSEVVEAKYIVRRIERLLYDERLSMRRQVMNILGMIGGIEAETALQTFVDKETGVPGMESLAKKAQEILNNLRQPSK